MKNKHCEWCDGNFIGKVSYQIYCSPECRELATKEKIAERYAIARRARMANKDRPCRSCGARLSIYNDDSLCQKCLVNPVDVKKALKEIKGFLNEKNT